MLQINNLSITTDKGRVLLEDFSFVLNQGDKVALIGEEGNGKSTILKILAGQDVSDYVSYTGSIIADGKLGYLPQKLDEKWNDSTVLDYLLKEEPHLEISPESYQDYGTLTSLFVRVNADQHLLEQERIMGTLSGGEKIKIQIIRLLYQKCDILLLDEPTNDLDLKTLIWLEEFIKNTDCAVLFVSHDETLLENCAEGILHLEQLKKKTECRISYFGDGYERYRSERLHMTERINMIARKEKSQLQKQMDKYRQIYQKVEYQQNTISRQDPSGGRLLKKKMHAVKALGRNLELKKQNLTQKYEPEEAIDVFFEEISLNPSKVILDLHLDQLKTEEKVLAEGIDLHIRAAEKICIIGDNGSGKTTLMRIIREKLSQREDIRVGYMPQNYHEVMNEEMNPVDYLMEEKDFSFRSRAGSMLGSLKFTPEEMTHPIRSLSEGQKCKILLARLILDGCEVLLMDEPTRNLSPLSNPKVREILAQYGGCIISVSHDRKFIEEVCDKVYLLDQDGLKLIDR